MAHPSWESDWLSEHSRFLLTIQFYKVTKAGLRQLKQETSQWMRISAAMASALPKLRSNYVWASLTRAWRNLAHRRADDDELSDEIRSYQTMLKDEQIRAGSDPHSRAGGVAGLLLARAAGDVD